MNETMTGRQRMLTAFALQEPDCVPVAPDISAMVPVRLARRAFDEMFLDGLPHDGYASASVAQAYVDAVRHYGMDGWYIYGSLPEVIPAGRPQWQTSLRPGPGSRQVRCQVARTVRARQCRDDMLIETCAASGAPPGSVWVAHRSAGLLGWLSRVGNNHWPLRRGRRWTNHRASRPSSVAIVIERAAAHRGQQ